MGSFVRLIIFLSDYHNGTTLLDVTDLHSAMLLPYDEGARGVVIWMGGNNPLHTEVHRS